MSTIKCPVCQATVDAKTYPHRPFCSQRCQQLDLAKWLDEEYGVPYEGLDDEEFEESFDEQMN